MKRSNVDANSEERSKYESFSEGEESDWDKRRLDTKAVRKDKRKVAELESGNYSGHSSDIDVHSNK